MKVSVIIPVYNAEKFIERALRSVLQFDEVGECIVVDDGSKDRSVEICKKIKERDDRIKLYSVENGQNKGAGIARNIGLNNAKEELISFLDADDYYLQNRFDCLSKFQENLELDAFIEPISTELYKRGEDENGLTMFKERLKGVELLESMEPFGKSGYPSILGITIRHKSFEKTGEFSKFRIGSDTEWIAKMILTCNIELGSLTQPVAIRHLHNANTTKNIVQAISDKPRMCLNLLRWLVKNDFDKRVRECVVTTLLKYHFEANHIFSNRSWIQKKSKDFVMYRLVKRADPNVKSYSKFDYFRKTIFHIPVKQHINYYE